eukprot:TRINITY_DN113312_c0_g1_i1.p1 TRINITY_DN113312_c0_g1~~TRINITY_DN113312_c0_g1_i1.p1  ORF type:complete len:264 (+),score=14.14 TRINITY_DN113312_c0_g1_i1:23-793(+)
MADTEALDAFSQECFKLGCLKGFKYFKCYLRGREELIVTIRDRNRQQFPEHFSPIKARLLTVVSKGHPPASPCNREPEQVRNVSDSEYVFLVATYARYGRPIVWIRSQNPKMKFGRQEVENWACDAAFTATDMDEDLPLRLYTIEKWPQKPTDVHIWDIIAELINICVSPPPTNPFELDWDEAPLKSLPTAEMDIEQRKEMLEQLSPTELGQLLFPTSGLISQLQIMKMDNETQNELKKLLYAHFELSSGLPKARQ